MLSSRGPARAAPVDAKSVAPPSLEELRQRLERARAAPAKSVTAGSLESIAFTLDVAERISKDFRAQSLQWRARAASYLALAEKAIDPLLEQRGKITMRGYVSPISEYVQGYAIYLPPGYDATKSYPLLVMLHGGSANGNLFLGVVLGNNMNWKEYSEHLWDEFEPRWSPDWIVVAPDGYGQVLWRWMGEQDVLDVIDDVQKHYNIDRDRVALGGLSNGGIGAYNLGMRHADRFSVVTAIAGAPSWLQYAGGGIPPEQSVAMAAQSGMELIENAFNTDLRYFHGHLDHGPMKPRFVEALGQLVHKLAVPARETWFDAGHDLLYLVHRGGRIYNDLAPLRRKQRPSEVRVVTGDYRAARQHWVDVTRIERYPELARVSARADGASIKLETRNVRALELDLKSSPAFEQPNITLTIDEQSLTASAPSSGPLQLTRNASGWHVGAPPASNGPEKRPGSSGPIPDAYYGAMAHVYGTGDPASTEALKKSATRGAQGWPLWLWRVRQKVLADTEVTPELMRTHHLVLYGTPGSNRVLEQIGAKLPIGLEADAVRVGARTFRGRGVGVKLIYPNPLAPERYVLVQAAPTTAGVEGGNQLPDFLPDYVVYDASTTASRPRLNFDRSHKPLAMGYFDATWQLPELSSGAANKRVETGSAAPPAGGPHENILADVAPKAPPALTASDDAQATQAARSIAKLVTTFPNYRVKVQPSTWITTPEARWSIRTNEACMQVLKELGVPARTVTPRVSTPIPTPVEITGPVEGVTFRMVHSERSLLMSCELAARLPMIAKILAKHEVQSVDVISSYRDHPFCSFHTFGLALDLARFHTSQGVLEVVRDFTKTPKQETCKTDVPANPRARVLHEIACELGQTLGFSSVLTPNYNAGHRDHFHLDIRPDDDRVFIR